jgi:hypothetical protein
MDNGSSVSFSNFSSYNASSNALGTEIRYGGGRSEREEERTPWQSQAPSLSAVKERQQKTWTSGNYARISNPLVIM